MKALSILKARIHSDVSNKNFETLYGNSQVSIQKERYSNLIKKFEEVFSNQTIATFFSAPGRTEIGGNHTDHNGGRVLAAAISLDIVALVALNTSNQITIASEGYNTFSVSLGDLEPRDAEKYTSLALVRGICARFKELGYSIGGFDAVISGQVPKGAGLSSSAAFEVLIAGIQNTLFNNSKIGAIEIAQIAQYSENKYFGKPCGLMDQTTCAVGGMISIDFENFDAPKVNKVSVNFSLSGYSLFIIDTGGNHADLNDDYIALEHEMKSVAQFFGKDVLRQIKAPMVYNQLANVRTAVGDRAILRALHFFADDQRVVNQVKSLERADFDTFLKLITESGESSWMLCQNCYSNMHPHEQGITIALQLTKSLLKNKGAYRVHGGGFAGTIQTFVPNDEASEFKQQIAKVFGENKCHSIQIRNEGCINIDL